MTIQDLISLSLILAFSFCLLAAALSDARHYRIPNRIPVAIILLWILYILVDWSSPGGGEVAILWHLIVALVVFLVFFAAFAWGRMGGGDVKLIGATTLWVGLEGIAPFLILTSIGGIVVAGAQHLRRRSRGSRRKPSESNDAGARSGNSTPSAHDKVQIPYGIAIAFGGLFIAGQLIVNRFT